MDEQRKKEVEEFFHNAFHHFSRGFGFLVASLPFVWSIFNTVVGFLPASQTRDMQKGISAAKIGTASAAVLADVLLKIDQGQAPTVDSELAKQLQEVVGGEAGIFFKKASDK